MNPQQRLMLQVTLDDAAQADEVFTTLMGEDVEQRRSFIQRNAKDVRFLNISLLVGSLDTSRTRQRDEVT